MARNVGASNVPYESSSPSFCLVGVFSRPVGHTRDSRLHRSCDCVSDCGVCFLPGLDAVRD
jgi:hypothetical protein